MKRFTLLALGTIFGLNLAAQKANRIATPEQRSQVVTYQDRFQQMHYAAEPTLVSAQPYVQESNVVGTGKVAAVAPIQLGRASNIFSILRTEQNQVYADNNVGVVAFIHRQDVTVWGGGGAESGKLRFDLSVDGGASFVADVDVLNNTYTRPSRYPNLTGFNPNNETNPFSTFLAYSAPTLNSSPDWDGHVTGMVGVTASAPAGATETYSLLSSQTYLQGGLTEGLPGEFWTVENRYDGTGFPGEIFVNKGTYNATSADIAWVRFDTILPPHFTGFDGASRIVGPNIAFSPDGMNGWIAWLGDLVGGTDTTYSPCVIQTTDGGATWGTAMEADFNQDPIVASSLTAFWTQVDSITGDTIAASTGIGTTAFDYDFTVDGNGNPHIFTIIGSASTIDAPVPGYSIFSGIEKFAADIWSPDGGATWKVTYVAPVLAFRGDFGATDPISMDNYPQISRTPSGDHVFYSWVDSDTSAATGSMNGIGFGVSDQLAPNLRIAGLRISDEYQTCYKRVTDGDFIWEGRALFPTMAPEVIIENGMVKLPIVMAEMITNEPLQSCNFWYFGNDATIDPVNDFGDPSQLNLEWDEVCTPIVSIENPMLEGFILGQSFPNPTNGEAEIGFELPFASEISMDLVNMYGQQVAVITAGEFAAGSHKVSVDTRDLAAGLYFYNLKVNDQVLTQKMMVTK